MLISKVDTILKPFINLHFKHGLIKYLSKVFKTISIPFEETSNQADGFLRFLVRTFIVILGVVLCIIATPLYLVIYVLTALITFVIATFVVIGTGLFYGLFPFLLPDNNTNYYDKETNKKNYKGYNVLLAPISWNTVVFNYTGKYLFNLGFRPVSRIKELNKCDYQSHILDRIGLALASVISSIIYSFILCGLVEVFANFFILLIAIVSICLWMIIYVFDSLVLTLFKDKDGE